MKPISSSTNNPMCTDSSDVRSPEFETAEPKVNGAVCPENECSNAEEVAVNNGVEGDKGSIWSHDSSKAGIILENTNIYKSAFHIFKANVGTGVFLLPTFYKDAGYVMGPILGLFIGACVIDATYLLLRTKLIINRHGIDTYGKLCRFVWGPPLQWALFIALILTQFGFCLMYVQLAAGTMDEMVAFKGSTYVWMLATFFMVFPLTCFSYNLSLLAIASILATIAVAFALGVTLVNSVVEIHNNGGMSPHVDPVGRNLPFGWFNNIANNMMVLEGIAIVLPVHSGCCEKPRFGMMILVVLACVLALYFLYGFIGYAAYGTTINTSLISGLSDDPFSIVVRVTFIINLICTHPVQFQSAIQLIEQLTGIHTRSWKAVLLRFVINSMIVGLAMIIGPSTVEIVVSFIGALPATAMVLIFPSLLNLQLDYAVEHPDEDRLTFQYWKKVFTHGPPCSWIRVRCYAYIILAVMIMVIGTYSIALNL